MSFDFPNSPSGGQIATNGGVSYTWDGSKWAPTPAAGATAGVSSFNTRTGAVTLSSGDVTTALPPSSTTPAMDGAAAVGTGTTWARADHVHPSDTSRAPTVSPTFTGTPTLPTGTIGVTQTAGNSSTALATTAFVATSFAPLAAPVFTGDARAVTPAAGDNDTSIATTAFVQTAITAGTPNSNVVDNSGFSVNQRSYVTATALAAAAFGHDRWKGGASGCTYSFTQSGGPATTITITAGSLQQVIEGAALLSGSYTLSWTGTAQGRTGAGSYAASPVAVTATAGTNLTIEFNTGTLGQVKLEPGTTRTAWVAPQPAQELTRCHRFYQAIGGMQFAINAPAAGSITFQAMPFQPMRAAPSVNFAVTGSGNCTGMNLSAVSSSIAQGFFTGVVAAGATYLNANIALSADL